MKTDHQKRVEEFMWKAGQSIPAVPTEPDEKTRILRARLIIEEALETTKKGLGIVVSDIGNSVELKIENLQFVVTGNPDLVEISDGIADLSVVSVGTAIACGINMEPIQKAVDYNNLEKFSVGHYIRPDGKLVKPPGHKPPDLKTILETQGWTETQLSS